MRKLDLSIFKVSLLVTSQSETLLSSSFTINSN